MRVSIVVLALVWPLTAALTIGYIFVGDRIVRHVSRREGRKYSILWPLNPRWHWEMGQLGWFGEAQDAGYGKALIVIYAGYVVLFVAFVILVYGGFVAEF
jgi:hypothetical protein